MQQGFSFPIGLDVVWEPLSRYPHLPSHIRSWLQDSGSLTDRVESACSVFNLTLIGEGEAQLHACERQSLHINGTDNHTVREVLLCGDERPWVFARSVIPPELMSSEFNQLGEEPLGRRLFNDARFRRGEFEVCRIRHTAFTPEIELPLWGRRSVFYFQQHALLVAELFLPASPLYQTDS